MPFDEPPQQPSYPPDPESIFRAIRAHLRASRATGFLLHDEEGGYYVAVDTTSEDIIRLGSPGKMTPYKGKD